MQAFAIVALALAAAAAGQVPSAGATCSMRAIDGYLKAHRVEEAFNFATNCAGRTQSSRLGAEGRVRGDRFELLRAFGSLTVLEPSTVGEQDGSVVPHGEPEIWASWENDGETHRLRTHVYGQGESLPSLDHTPLHGIVVSAESGEDAILLLNQDPFECESGTTCFVGDRAVTGADAKEQAIRRGRAQRLSGLRDDVLQSLESVKSVSPATAAEARHLRRVRSGLEVEECALEEGASTDPDTVLCSANHARRLKVDPKWAQGTRKVLVARYIYQEDDASISPSIDTIATTVQAAGEALAEWSWGQVSFTSTVYRGAPMRMTVPRSRQQATSEIATSARAVMKASGFHDPDDFDHFVIWLPKIPVGWAGLASITGKDLWMNECPGCTAVLVHELGHNMGLKHANIRKLDQSTLEYGDSHDVMGGGVMSGQFQAGYKHGMQWYSDSLSHELDNGADTEFVVSAGRTVAARLAPSDAKLPVSKPTAAAMVTDDETSPLLSVRGNGRAQTGGNTFYVSHMHGKSDRYSRAIVHSLDNAASIGPSVLTIPAGVDPDKAGMQDFDAIVYKAVAKSTPTPRPNVVVQQVGESVHAIAGVTGAASLFPTAGEIADARTSGRNVLHVRVGEMDPKTEIRAEGRGHSAVYGAEPNTDSAITSFTGCDGTSTTSLTFTAVNQARVLRIAPTSGSVTYTVPVCGYPLPTTVAAHSSKPLAVLAMGGNAKTGADTWSSSTECAGDNFQRTEEVTVPAGAERFVVIALENKTALSTPTASLTHSIELKCSATPPCGHRTFTISGIATFYGGEFTLSKNPTSIDGQPVYVRTSGGRYYFYSAARGRWGVSSLLTGQNFFAIDGTDANTKPADLQGKSFFGTINILCSCPMASYKDGSSCVTCTGGKSNLLTGTTCVCPPGMTDVSGTCTPCAENTFKFEAGNQACSTCPGGLVTGGTGATACHNPATVSTVRKNFCDTYVVKGFGSTDGTYVRMSTEVQDGAPVYERTGSKRFLRSLRGTSWIFAPEASSTSFFKRVESASPPGFWGAEGKLESGQAVACVCVTSNFTTGASVLESDIGRCTCGAGEYQDAAKGVCTKCPPGTYRESPFDTTDSCSACPKDRATLTSGNTAASDCSVPECAQYSITVAGDSAASGTYSLKCVGGSGCDTTQTGLFAYQTSSSYRFFATTFSWRLDDDGSVGNGFVYSATRSGSAMPSTITSVTKRSDNTDATFSATCTGCVAPFYYDAATAGNDNGPCQHCPVGTETVANMQSRSGCVCSAGYGGSGPDGCTKCSKTSKKATAGNAACEECPATFVATASGTDCECPAGHSLSGGKCVDDNECASKTCSHRCENVPGDGYCTCPPGKGLPSKDGATCASCPAGTASDSWGTTCEKCPAGSSPDTGALRCVCAPVFQPLIVNGKLTQCVPPSVVRVVVVKAAPGSPAPQGAVDGSRGADQAAAAVLTRVAAADAVAETTHLAGVYRALRGGVYRSGDKYLCNWSAKRSWVIAHGSCDATATVYAIRPNTTTVPLVVSGWRVYHHSTRGFDPEPLLSVVALNETQPNAAAPYTTAAADAAIAADDLPVWLPSSATKFSVTLRGPVGPADRLVTVRIGTGSTASEISALCASIPKTVAVGAGTAGTAPYVVAMASTALKGTPATALIPDVSSTLVPDRVSQKHFELSVPTNAPGRGSVAVCVQPITLARGGAFTGGVPRSVVPFSAVSSRTVPVLGTGEAVMAAPAPLVRGETISLVFSSPSLSAGEKVYLAALAAGETATCTAKCGSLPGSTTWATLVDATPTSVESTVGDMVAKELKNGTSGSYAEATVEVRKAANALLAPAVKLANAGDSACLCVQRSSSTDSVHVAGGWHAMNNGQARILSSRVAFAAPDTSTGIGGGGNPPPSTGGDGTGTGGDGTGSGSGTTTQNCPTGQFQSVAATGNTAQVCTACRPACNSTEEETAACTTITDRACQALPPPGDRVGEGKRGRVKLRLVIAAQSAAAVPRALLRSMRRVIASIAGVPVSAVFVRVVTGATASGRRLLSSSVSLDVVIDTTPDAGSPTATTVAASLGAVAPAALATRLDADLATAGEPQLAAMGVTVQQAQVEEATTESGTVIISGGAPASTPPPETKASNALLVVGILSLIAVVGTGVGAYFYLRAQSSEAKPVHPKRVNPPGSAEAEAQPNGPETHPSAPADNNGAGLPAGVKGQV